MNPVRSARATYVAAFFLGVLIALLLAAPAHGTPLPSVHAPAHPTP